MADKQFHVSGRGVVELYHDNGDGTHSRVLFNRHVVEATDIPMQISGRAVTIKYHRNSDGVTHSEVIYDRASSQAGDRTMELSGWGIKIKYRQMPDGTFAEVVWLGVSNQASDKIFEIPSRSIKIKYRNMGDGTYAQVLWADPSTRSSDKTYPISGRDVTLRYRDMGDGSFAEVVYIFSPAELFTAGEQGAWYDPAEFSTLFQDSAGTTPVTAVEQAVGLMLDKSKGLVSAAVTVTNGGFDADSDWTKGTGWSIGSGVATKSAGTAANLTQTIATTTGQWYRVTATLTRTAGGITVSLGTSGTTSGSVTAAGTYIWYILAGSSTQTLTFAADASFAGTVDNVSVNSVSGNHAYQSTSTSRPTLRARYNLLTYSEQFDNAAWSKDAVTVSANTTATTDPLGGNSADKVEETTTTAAHVVYLTSIFAASAIQYTLSCYVKAAERTFARIDFITASYAAGATAILDFSNLSITITNYGATSGTTATVTSAGNGWHRLVMVIQGTAANYYAQIGPARSGTASQYAGILGSGIYIWGADLRVANDGVGIPAYQRIAAATDYDTAGFPVYLDFCESFGGTNTDNSLLTNSIDFSGTDKMTVFAGVRKINTRGTIAEISANANLNNGAFYLGPGSSVDSDALGYTYWTRGTVTQFANSPANYPVPDSAVLAATSSISGDSAILRANGAQVATSSLDQGTGNYGNYPLYIGRRNNASLPLSGRLYSLIVRGATTSDAQIASTEAWVNGRTKAY